ncbi:unnamed protein product [Ilex paraguariensis]|uniref:Uncharacterized protein n=1 Tax=Ilex paraguariensis TaxID=185542 RepID=A0ABC8QZQ2_9AQUA
MLSGNDPVESLFNTLQVVKNAFSPLESGIRKAAKDLEHCWPVMKNGASSSNGFVTTQNVVGENIQNNNNKFQVCSVKKESWQCVANDERKKDLSITIPIKAFFGMFPHNYGLNGHNKVDISPSKDVGTVKEDGTCMNCLQVAVTCSLLLGSFVQAIQSPFETNKKLFQKMNNEDKVCMHSCGKASKSRVLCELKQKELKGQPRTVFHGESLKDKEGNNMSLDCFIGFIFDQFTQNLQKFDQGHKERACKSVGTTHLDHWKAITSILEGKRADVNGFLGSLKFARVGGVPSTMVGVTSSVKEDGENGVSTDSREDTGGSSPQKLASGLLSIPLSNVERLRSTLSTVSFTELIELVPQLGRSSKDYPDKKKLFSVQDFFKYTESEGANKTSLSCLIFLRGVHDAYIVHGSSKQNV